MNSPQNTPINSGSSTPTNTPYIISDLSSSNTHFHRPSSYHRRYRISRSNLQKLTEQRNQNHLLLQQNQNSYQSNYHQNNSTIRSPRHKQEQTIKLPHLKQNKILQNSNLDYQQDQTYNHSHQSQQLAMLNQTIFNYGEFQVTMKLFQYQNKSSNEQMNRINNSKINNPQKVIQFYLKKIIQSQKSHQSQSLHFHSDYNFHMLSPQMKFVFGNLDNLYEYIAANVNVNNQKTSQVHKKLQIIQIMSNGEIIINVYIPFYPNDKIALIQQQKSKILKRQLFIQTFQLIMQTHNESSHSFKNQENQQNKKILQKLDDIQKQKKLQKEQYERRILELQKQLIQSHKYTQQLKKSQKILNDTLTSYKQEYDKNNEEKQELIEELQNANLSIKSIKNQEHLFEFIPDKKLHNYQNFKFKGKGSQYQTIKIHRDLKWDQICSESSIPQTKKHYFSFTIKSDILDFMFGIVTLKGKDTLNAFSTTQAICLYVSKSSLNIYQMGKHFKISSQHQEDNQKEQNFIKKSKKIFKNDTIFVEVDMDKGEISWSKGRILQDKSKQDQSLQNSQIKENQEKISTTQKNTLKTQLRPRPRKSSESLSNSRVSINVNHPNEIQIIQNKMYQEREFLYSCKISSQILSHRIFGYLEVYNLNDKIIINAKQIQLKNEQKQSELSKSKIQLRNCKKSEQI